MKHALSLVCLLSGALIACSSDDSSVAADSVFSESPAVNERFGTTRVRDTDPDVTDADLDATVVALNDFSLTLQRAATDAQPSENGIASGYSAAVALSLAMASTSGDTRSALMSLLNVDALDETVLHRAQNALALALQSRGNDELVLRTANRVFVRPGLPLAAPFLDIATADYGAPVVEADFAGANDEVIDRINAWASAATDGFIPSIVQTLSPDTVFALLNAIFLDAAWDATFSALPDGSFTTLDGNAVDVPTFGGTATVGLYVDDALSALDVPYAGGELSLLVMMPRDLASFEAALDGAALATVVASLAPADVDVRLPSWRTESSLDLATLLGPAGLPASPWRFDRLTDSPLSLDVIALQKARIEVDENGTRAAAVTLVAVDDSERPTVTVDRPFVYALRDRVTGAVLFTGRVVSLGG